MTLPRSEAVLALVGLLAVPLAAQTRTGITADLNLGASAGSGGSLNYTGNGQAAVEFTVGRRRSGQMLGMSLTAVTVGAHAAFARGDKCFIDPNTNGCRPQYPDFAHIGVLAGVERSSSAGTLRLLAGPALYGRSDGQAGVGALVHANVATPSVAHVALVLSARGSVFTRFSETFRLGAAGIGLRIE